MRIRPWAGMIARLDQPTTDGRTLLRAYWLPPLPVVSAKQCAPIGTVDGVRMVEDGPDRALFAVGWIMVDDQTEERYEVGIDLLDVETDIDDATGEITILGGNVRGLTVYDDGESRAAWPDCHIQILV